MAHRTLPQGIRQESLSYRGHQVVVTYNDNTNEITVETNGSVKKRLVRTGEDTYSVYDGAGKLKGSLLVDHDYFRSDHLLLLLTQRDLEE